LIIRQKLSCALDEYTSPSPAARAALQLQKKGRQFVPGQSIEFLFARNISGVHAWELDETLELEKLNINRYFTLLDRAMQTVLNPCNSKYSLYSLRF
jgi:DNA polymerase elongation subunit (family B)